MSTKYFFVILSFLVLLVTGCNPDCNPIGFIEVPGNGFVQGQEILIKAEPPSSLEGKDVLFSARSTASSAGSVTVTAKESRYVPGVGLLVKVPEGIEGADVDLLIDDPDCGPITLGRPLTVGDEAFFTNNPDFIVPPNFNFVIPVSVPVFPPLIRNAWLHPTITDYCLWFRFVLDEDDNETITLCPATSRELNIGCESTNEFYHDNPVYGIIDKHNNYINFFVDRTSKNAGIEEFEGQFIDIADSNPTSDAVPCQGNWVPGRSYMMLLVSKQTGRQLIIYQQQTQADANGNGLALRTYEMEEQCRYAP